MTDVCSDEAVFLYNQYSTHWDALAHRGMMFDANGDGVDEPVFYNGFSIVDSNTKQGTQGSLGATALSIDRLAETCVQGRGVMIDLHHHFGYERVLVDHAKLMRVLELDNVEVEAGDVICLHTGFSQLIVESQRKPDASIRNTCPVLDGWDPAMLGWIDRSGIAAIAADNIAVEAPYRPYADAGAGRRGPRGPALPLHEHCLVKLGIHLGEFWYLTELAAWLRKHQRSRFLLTAPPLRLPGAVGAPVSPVATV
jgi:kynurenine formamidase